jgi:CHAD domain-containing protein
MASEKAKNKLARSLASRARTETKAHNHSREFADRVHDLRVRIKVLRSLLRLLKLAGSPQPASFDRRLRALAGEFSASRDLTVTNEWLAAHGLPEQAAASPHLLPKRLAAAEAELKKMETKLLDSLEKKSLGQASLARALASSVHAVGKLGRRAEKSGRDRDFHSWRKRAKNLQYQLNFFGGSPSALKRLGHHLGQVQDRVIVEDFLRRLKLQPWILRATRIARSEKTLLQRQALRELSSSLPRHSKRWAKRLLQDFPAP